MGTCPTCSAAVPAGSRFCGSCGRAIDVGCRVCGGSLAPGQRFCSQCGTPAFDVVDGTDAASPTGVTERRICSVLFVDLVSFTPLSESRDAEEVRDLLSRYFTTARAIIDRYGGVVEKFIGDAVMAVWGTPVATEGDTERAVRAGLDLLAAIEQLGADIGAPTLRARAGVVTGEVAATLSAVGEGMVAGDTVNTAARVQSVATPGTLLVDDASRRLASAAISFQDAGLFELKGKTEPERLWSAVQVTSGVGGSQRVDGLEAPFVGRDVEFRLVKDLFHATEQDRQSRLVVVTGPAGVGKSRLGWEFEKYIDGLADTVYWHRGKCLSYGEDIAFWALAEIVRQRLGVSDEDETEAVTAKLQDLLAGLFDDPRERDSVSAALGQLLGLAPESGAGHLARPELFAGWRRFFERLGLDQPVLLLIEDLQYADVGLLDFIEHLVDWTRDVPILVLGFTRPDIDGRRPGFGAGRHRTLITLDPLPEPAMRRLLDGLVAELPPDAAEQIANQAQGIPLFAVESVRSLIDRDVVIPRDGVYTLVGDFGELQVPDSLHTLLAARIDALDPLTRSLVSDAAVLGSNFMAETLTEISELSPEQVSAGLAELVRRDVLQVSADELSPQIGSYSFSHGLLAQVAYATLSRRDLKRRHLKVAAHLEASPRSQGDALAELIARHYLDALEARPDDSDVTEVRATSVAWLIRAGERASRTGGQASAANLFATAAEHSAHRGGVEADLEAAELWLRAAGAAQAAADDERVIACAQRAADLAGTHGRQRLVATARSVEARGYQRLGRVEIAREMLVEAVATLDDEPGPDTVAALLHLASLDVLTGHEERDATSTRALQLGQALGVEQAMIADLLSVRGMVHATYDRISQAEAYLRESARVAEQTGDSMQLTRAVLNLGDAMGSADPAEALVISQRAAALAERAGARLFLLVARLNIAMNALVTGDWELVRETFDESVGPLGLDDIDSLAPSVAFFAALRGDAARARELLDREFTFGEPQDIAQLSLTRAATAYAEGDLSSSLREGLAAVEVAAQIGKRSDVFRWSWGTTSRAAYELGDLAASEQVLDLVRGLLPGATAPLVRAEQALAEARLLTDPAERDLALTDALAGLRELGSPYHLAQGLLDRAEQLHPDAATPLVDESRALAEKLGAEPVLRRAERLAARSAAVRAGTT